MPETFNSFLVNDTFGDPGLFIQFLQQKRAFMFDIGDISSLSIRQLLTITDIFITHTHIDHFFGFDRILRLYLGRKKFLSLYGPPGLCQNIEGKLKGYNWNLINKYEKNLTILVKEIYKGYSISRIYQSKYKFKSSKEKRLTIKNNIITSEKNFNVIAVILDHGTPCLGFSIQERARIKIIFDKIKYIGLKPGPWISYLKESLTNNLDKENFIEIENNKAQNITFDTLWLKKNITQISSGQKITYITDVSFTNRNQERIIKLAQNSTHLFIEATFSTKQKNMAIEKKHLTAEEAGKIAAISKSKKYTLFHHSPRYYSCSSILQKEAKEAYKKEQMKINYRN